MHETRGKYIDASDFGTDPTGKTDSLPAIKAALPMQKEPRYTCTASCIFPTRLKSTKV